VFARQHVHSFVPLALLSQRPSWARIVILCQHAEMQAVNPIEVPPAMSPEPGIHPIYLRLLAVLLKQQGVKVERVLAEAGLSAEDLLQGEAAIDVATLRALVDSALRHSGSPWLGLQLGAEAQAFSHGPVGFAAIASGSLLQALEVACRFIALRAPVLRLELRRGASHTRLIVHEQADLGTARRFVLEALLVMLERLLQSISGSSLVSVQHQLPWLEPPWSRNYAAYLAGRLSFAAPRLVSRFPNVVLDSACLSADPQAFELARLECERRLQSGAAERDLASRVRRQLWHCEGNYPDAETSAARLGMSLRSFYRSLAAAGCSYRGLLDEARCARAQRLLFESDATVAAISERLGYADPSNFSRCFRRWCGKTPREFREAGRADQSLRRRLTS
jgi:AraC-like DNA-binding protein